MSVILQQTVRDRIRWVKRHPKIEGCLTAKGQQNKHPAIWINSPDQISQVARLSNVMDSVAKLLNK